MELLILIVISDWEDSDYEKMNRDDNKCFGFWEDEEE